MKSLAPLDIDRILAAVKTASVLHLWQALAMQAAADQGLATKFIFDHMLEQERHSPSGIGDGVAITPLRLAPVTKPYLLFARTTRPLPLRTLDNRPVDLFFLLLSPVADITGHLQNLSALSRLMRDARLCEQLRAVDNADGLSAVLLAEPGMLRAA